MDIRDLIIEKPELLKRSHHITGITITFVFWFIMFYLWQPFISLIAWGFGYKFFYEHMIILGGIYGFLNIVGFYLITVSLMGITLILWAKINQWRFRGKCQRGPRPVVPPEGVADYFHVDHDDFNEWRQQKNITLLITQDFEITRVDPVNNSET